MEKTQEDQGLKNVVLLCNQDVLGSSPSAGTSFSAVSQTAENDPATGSHKIIEGSGDRGLLPCPFCGGEAERIQLDDGDNAGGDVICCTKCEASSHVEFGRKENLVASWNRRAALPARVGVRPLTAKEIRKLAAELYQVKETVVAGQARLAISNESLSVMACILAALVAPQHE